MLEVREVGSKGRWRRGERWAGGVVGGRGERRAEKGRWPGGRGARRRGVGEWVRGRGGEEVEVEH